MRWWLKISDVVESTFFELSWVRVINCRVQVESNISEQTFKSSIRVLESSRVFTSVTVLPKNWPIFISFWNIGNLMPDFWGNPEQITSYVICAMCYVIRINVVILISQQYFSIKTLSFTYTCNCFWGEICIVEFEFCRVEFKFFSSYQHFESSRVEYRWKRQNSSFFSSSS